MAHVSLLVKIDKLHVRSKGQKREHLTGLGHNGQLKFRPPVEPKTRDGEGEVRSLKVVKLQTHG